MPTRKTERTKDFAGTMRDQQLAWALGGHIPVDALERRHGRVSWVLKRDHQRLNLFRPGWWKYIERAEHRWARALNSSQCFAVNVFAPLADDAARAVKVLRTLLPGRNIEAQDNVSLKFEFTPVGASDWLGERKQATQVDVYLGILRSGRCIGHVLVEVKFTESRFGCCRGWEDKRNGRNTNPDRSRCLSAQAVLSAPEENCWLAQAEKRKYWRIMRDVGSSIREEAIRTAGACPFRHGLYQLMRNRILADELVRHSEAAWADFAVCRHPANGGVLLLDEPVSSRRDAIEAFRSLSSETALLDWDAEEFVRVVSSTGDQLKDWETWMIERYFR